MIFEVILVALKSTILLVLGGNFSLLRTCCGEGRHIHLGVDLSIKLNIFLVRLLTIALFGR